MSLTHGMNVETIRLLAKSFDAQATTVQQLETRINQLVAQAERYWTGSDSTQFVGEWNNTHRKAIFLMKSSLEDLANILKSNAAAQETTSSEYDTTSSSGNPQPPYSNLLKQNMNLSPEDKKLISDKHDHDLALDAQDRDRGNHGASTVHGFTLAETIQGDDGFSAYVYEDRFGNKKIVFPGMTWDAKGDVPAVGIGLTGITNSDRQAIALAKRINESLKDGASLNMVGYSMGGRHAALASIATETTATTFAASGASVAAIAFAQRGGTFDTAEDVFNIVGGTTSTVIGALEQSNTRLYNHSITNYSASTDLVEMLQTHAPRVGNLASPGVHDALGEQVRIPGNQNPFDTHSLSKIGEGMGHIQPTGLPQF